MGLFDQLVLFATAKSFWVLSALTVTCSLGMIFNPNLVRAGYLLIASFVAIAGLYFMLSANFVAISQILIYAVGIVLVIIFAIMLCSLKETAAGMANEEEKADGLQQRKIFAFITCSVFFLLLSYVINTQDWNLISHITGAQSHAAVIDEITAQYTAQIGHEMLSVYLLPFELISVLLLIVLVGVVILSKKKLAFEDDKAIAQAKK